MTASSSRRSPAPGHPRTAGRLPAAADWLDRNALFVAALSIAWVALLARVPARLAQDGWLALVAGREVADRGLPQHDRLAVLTHGARWVDQQWLSQLTMYELYRIGGLALFCIASVGLSVAAVGMAIAAARDLGASDLHVTAVLAVPAVIFIAASGAVRTQALAYPLFVGLLWLLAAQSRAPDRRGYLFFPVLVLWANLHGSVVFGAALGVLHGLSLLAGARRTAPGRPGVRARATLFMLGSPVCLLVTPYGLAGVGYYHDTLLNSTFRSLISEWAPITSITILAVPFFLVAAASVWLLGRGGRSHPLFDHLVLYVTIAGGISAVRNVTWLGLAAIVLLPGLLGDAVGRKAPAPRRPQLNLAIAGLGATTLVVALALVATRPQAWFERGYDDRAATVVARAARADRSLRIYGGDRFSDWLLWHEPQLAGRIAYDSRLELLTSRQLRGLANLVSSTGVRPAAVIDGYRLLVLDPMREARLTKSFVSARGARVLYRRRGVVVVQRP